MAVIDTREDLRLRRNIEIPRLRTESRLELLLVTVPARVKTILEITTTVGATEGCEAVEVAESCTALTATAPDEAAGAEVEQYMAFKLLVRQALIKVSKSSIVF